MEWRGKGGRGAKPETFLNGRVQLHAGDSRDVLKTLADNSIDSIVCDPPYALVSIVKRFGGKNAAAVKVPEGGSGAYARASKGFMGKQWDTGETAFSVEFWSEVLRVLKPGGHVVAFSGTRTYHRMTCAIEDAGFEIRDMIQFLFRTGFPKSHDVSKGIAKSRSEDVEPVRVICRAVRAAMDQRGLKSRDLVQHFGNCDPRLIDHWAARDTDSQPSLPAPDQYAMLRNLLALPDDLDPEVNRLNGRKGSVGEQWSSAEVLGEHQSVPGGVPGQRFNVRDNLQRKLEGKAAEWEGWGTALKPANEPICLARKPLSEGTIAANVLKWGTGALNIDGCRVSTEEDTSRVLQDIRGGNFAGGNGAGRLDRIGGGHSGGRFPANVIHDGSDEVVSTFPESAGQQGDVRGDEPSEPLGANTYGRMAGRVPASARNDSGSAARFFYSSKADAHDRIGSKHPTVKPVDLMQWLCRLVTPRGGTILDPFAGTGTTGEAAYREGFNAVLIEREEEYQADIRRRMGLVLSGPDERARESIKARSAGQPIDAGPLFGGLDMSPQQEAEE